MYSPRDIAVMAAFFLAMLAFWFGLANAQLAMPPLPTTIQSDQWPTPSPTTGDTLVVPKGAAIYQGPLTTGTTEPLHYRCEMAKDGMTVTLIPLEESKEAVHFTFQCVNCLCDSGK